MMNTGFPTQHSLSEHPSLDTKSQEESPKHQVRSPKNQAQNTKKQSTKSQEQNPKHHAPSPKCPLLFALSYFPSKLLTNSIKLRTPIPDGPLAIQLLFSSIQAVPAMSRCSQGVSSTNSFRKTAAVLAPPQRPPVFMMSAMLERIWSRYSASSGRRQNFSPERCSAWVKCW